MRDYINLETNLPIAELPTEEIENILRYGVEPHGDCTESGVLDRLRLELEIRAMGLTSRRT